VASGKLEDVFIPAGRLDDKDPLDLTLYGALIFRDTLPV